MSNENDIKAALAAVEPKIKQPPLQPPGPNARIVRTAGLQFILPCNWKPGDVLDEQSAALLNAAHHTAVLNKFAPIRETFYGPDGEFKDGLTYNDIDRELQAHFDNFKWNVRRQDTSRPEPASEEDRELIAFARPHFNKAFGGQGLERKDYEALLREYVNTNREMLSKLMESQRTKINSLVDIMAAYGGAD